VETGQRRDVLRVKSIIEVLSVLARHMPQQISGSDQQISGLD
jgi:hypothetical protein